MSTAPRVAILEKQGGILSWHDDLAAGLRDVGAEVVTIQLRPQSLAEYAAKWRTGCSTLNNPAVVRRVARTLASFRPDLVVVLKHAALPAASVDEWRSALAPGVPIVGWLCDHLPKPPPASDFRLDGVYYFDSATRPVLDASNQGKNIRLAHLPLAVNPGRIPAHPRVFAGRVAHLVFAGKNSPSRRSTLDAYRALGGVVDAYGPGAADWRPWRRRHLDAASVSRLYTRHFAALNLLQQPNTVDGLNLRAFEIPASGGLATYPLVADLPALFVPGEEVVAYRDLADLKTQVDALALQPERAARIAAAGTARVLREHTFTHRARRMLDDWLT